MSAGEPRAAQVLASWRERESLVRSLRFVGESEITYARGALSAFGAVGRRVAGKTRLPPKDATPIPPKDVTLLGQFTYALDGAKRFYSQRGPSWSIASNSPEPFGWSRAFNGEDSTALYDKGNNKCPVVEVEYGKLNSAFGMESEIIMLMLIYRALSCYFPDRGISPETLCVRECRSAPAPQGLVTVAFWPPPAPEWIHYVWVDPSRAYLPLRCVLENGGKLMADFSIEYANDAAHGWVPVKWRKMSVGRNGELKQMLTVQVREASINEPLDDRLFEIAIPYGAWVNEHRGNVHKTYLALEGGRRRYLSKGERDVRNYEELMRSARGWSGLMRALAVAGGAGLLAAVLLIARRHAKQRYRQ